MIKLKSDKFKVVEIIGTPSKAAAFKHVKVGDRIQLDMTIRDTSGGRSIYATYIGVTTFKADGSTYRGESSQQALYNLLAKYHLKAV